MSGNGGICLEEIHRLDGKIEMFDSRMTKLEDSLKQTDIKLERNNVLTEQNTKVMEKFSDTLDSVSRTMQEISYVTKSLVSEVQEVKVDIAETNKRVDEFVEKSSFDIMGCIKDNWINIVVVSGLVVYIVLGKVGF